MAATRFILIGAVLASGGHADWLLSNYTLPAADSTAANAIYGIRSDQNGASSATVVVADGAVSLKAPKIASSGIDGTTMYSAYVGLFHPLTRDREPHDLTGITAVDFEFRNSMEITDALVVSFGSTAYLDMYSIARTVYQARIDGAAELAAGTDWKRGHLAIEDFATPNWWTDIPEDFPTFAEVLAKATDIDFTPATSYTGAGIGPTMTSQVLDIRRIVLVGTSKHPPVPWRENACTGAETVLDRDFDDNRNAFGGWFAISDFDSTGTSSDSTRGNSAVALSLEAGNTFASGSVTLSASLDKRVGTSWHTKAGWAAIGASIIPDVPIGDVYELDHMLKAFRFHVAARVLPPTVEGVNFKVPLSGIPDEYAHAIFLPASQLLIPGGTDFCILPSDLSQPIEIELAPQWDTMSWFRSDFEPPSRIRKLSWEARIADDRDPAIATAEVEFSVSDVRFYGFGEVGTHRRLASGSFAATYSDGLLRLHGIDGVVSIEIMSLNGRREALLAPMDRVAVTLPRGIWILAARMRGGSTVRRGFVSF